MRRRFDRNDPCHFVFRDVLRPTIVNVSRVEDVLRTRHVGNGWEHKLGKRYEAIIVNSRIKARRGLSSPSDPLLQGDQQRPYVVDADGATLMALVLV